MPYIGNPIYQSAFVVDQFSGNGSTTAFTMSVAPAGVTNVLVSVSGVLQDPSTYGVVGNTITFSAAPPSGTGNISCRYLGIPVTGVTTTAYRTVTEFTATASQTTFTPPSYTVGFINVYLNGVLLGSADYTATNGTTVVLATGASAGNLVTVESFLVSSVLNAIPNTAGSVSSSNIANDITINFADGSASTPSITNNGDTNTGIYFPAADTIAFTEGGAEAMRIDSSGNVGIGTTSPDIFSESYQINLGLRTTGATAAFQISGASASRILLGVGTTRTAQLYSDSANFTELATSTAKPLLFSTNSTERMRIDSSGRVGIATTSPSTYGQLAVRAGVNGTYFGITANSTLSVSDATNSTLAVLHNNSNSGTSFIGTDAGGRLQLFCSSTAAGGVYLANGGTSWTSASDERVKENLEPIQNGLEKVTSLRAVTGNYIADETKKSKAFLIAQDVEAVLPEAVDHSNPDELGLSYTDVIPLLVAAIQELKAELDATKAEVQALKGTAQ